MRQIFIFLTIFIILAGSRFIPHPPNFTSLIALSFYVPALLGIRYLPFVILSFVITDLIIGYHSGTHWTWGSVFLIGLISQYFTKTIISRITGALSGALIFYSITNFGVWTSGMYDYSISGLLECYILAIPFFTYNLLSTLTFSAIIEAVVKIKNYVKYKHLFF